MSKTHVIKLAGLNMLPHLSGALYVPECETVLVADLHLEQGAAMARRGVHLPPYDTLDTISALENVIAECAPKRLILLGDSFHDAAGHLAISDDLSLRLRTIAARVDVTWISGNHDPLSKDGLGGHMAQEVALTVFGTATMTLRHEPQQRHGNGFEIAGHLHPGCTVSQRGIHVRGKCFVYDERRLILPAFGRYTGALSLRSKAFDGLFDIASTRVLMLGRQQLHSFPWGRVS